jgi:hypothetical protein
MATNQSARELPNAIGPLAFAIASALAFAMAMSGTGNDALNIVVLLGALASVVLSTRYTVRTYRRLSEHEFKVNHALRWLLTVLALAINGIVCFMLAGSMLLMVGVLLTGRGVVG